MLGARIRGNVIYIVFSLITQISYQCFHNYGNEFCQALMSVAMLDVEWMLYLIKLKFMLVLYFNVLTQFVGINLHCTGFLSIKLLFTFCFILLLSSGFRRRHCFDSSELSASDLSHHPSVWFIKADSLALKLLTISLFFNFPKLIPPAIFVCLHIG